MFSITSGQPLGQGAEKVYIRFFNSYVSLCKLCSYQISREVSTLVDIIAHVVPSLIDNIIAQAVPSLADIIAHVVPH